MLLNVCLFQPLRKTLFKSSRANYCVELDVGQLIKDPYFTLFEAVGALEVLYDGVSS